MTKLCFIGDIHGKNSTPLGRLCDYNEDLFAKLAWIRNYCESNSIATIVHLGDIYDKPEASDEWKNKFIQMWSTYSGTFYSIIGKAHDLFYNNESSYSKTCLYNLELSGALKVLTEPVRIDEVMLVPLSMHIQQAKEQLSSLKLDASLENILLAHQFYNWDLDPNAGFTKEELEKLTVKTKLILGHDHRQHKSEIVGNCEVLRPGSLMRTELSELMIEQKPRVLIYDNGVYSYIEVPHRDISEIYDVQDYKLRKSSSKVFKQIHNNLEEVGKYLSTDSKDKVPCSTILKDLNCPKEEFEYLRAVHQICSQDF